MSLAIFLAIQNLANAQNTLFFTLKGKITNINIEPLPFSTIEVKNRTGINLGYTIANFEGYYELKFKYSDSVIVYIKSLGYEKTSKTLILNNEPTTIELDFTLHQSTTQLKEVTILERRTIEQKKDTVGYNILDFIDGSEQKVEDVLSKLPGINVSESGKITYQGKEIKKILLDGDDLTDTNYKVLSKNLSAQLLEGVQILKNYSDIRLLKGIVQTDDIAINLTLDKNKTAPLFGTMDIGAGTDKRYNMRMDALSYTKKLKGVLFSNINNIGDNPVDSDYERYSNGIVEYLQFQYGESLISFNRNYPPFITSTLFNFDRSKYTSANILYKLSQKVKFRNSIAIYNNKSLWQQSEVKVFNLNNDSTVFDQQKNNDFGITEIYSDNELKKEINKNMDLVIRSNIVGSVKATNDAIINETVNLMNGKNNRFVSTLEANVTNRIRENVAMINQLLFSYDQYEENYNISNKSIESYYKSQAPIYEQLNQSGYNLGFSNSFKINLDKTFINTTSAFIIGSRQLNSTTSIPLTDNTLTESNNNYNFSSLFTDIIIERKYNAWSIYSGARIRNENFAFQGIEDKKILVDPTIGVSFKESKISSTLVFNYENRLLRLNEIIQNPIVTDLNTILIGYPDFRSKLGVVSLAWSMKYSEMEKRFITAWLQVLSTKNAPFGGINLAIADQIIVTQNAVINDAQKQILINANIDKYVPKLKTTIKTGISFSDFSQSNFFEDEKISSQLSQYEWSVSSGTSISKFSFGILKKLSLNMSDFDYTKSNFYMGYWRVRCSWNPSTAWKTGVTLEQIKFYDNEIKNIAPIGKMYISKDFEKPKATLRLDLTNFLNSNSLNIQRFTALYSQSSTYHILPRYLLITGSFSF